MILDREIAIGKLTAPNRLVMPPMQTGKTNSGHVTDELAAYYRERALGSRPGLMITEHSCIAENARAAENQLAIYSDEFIPEHRRLTDAVHEGGCLAFVQLNHAGAIGIDEPVSPSGVNVSTRRPDAVPRALSVEEIRRIESEFASAAIRAVEAGYDGVEIHAAHSYLLNQFYSPVTNRRGDEYGGTLENRLRFLIETVARVREAVGGLVPLAVRLGGADYRPGGNTEEDAVQASQALEQAGADLLDISGGLCFFTRPGHEEPGYFSSMTQKIKARVSVPVILTGGIKTVEDAEALLADGKADMIGVGRALLNDPQWRKNACQ